MIGTSPFEWQPQDEEEDAARQKQFIQMLERGEFGALLDRVSEQILAGKPTT